jgi:molybdate transport system substrate-binding protein
MRSHRFVTFIRHASRTTRPLLLALLSIGAQAEDLTVYAAASLTDAMQTLSADWEKTSGINVKLSFAASSALAKQIEAGAQAGVFISADTQWVDYLQQRGLIAEDTRIDLLGNDLVLITPADNPAMVTLDAEFDLAAFLGEGRLATGDPAHVPVGYYAEAALKHLGLWAVAEPKLVRMDSVRAALVLVERGEVPAGIVYATDAGVSSKIHLAGTFPPDSHPPIVYPLTIIAANDTPTARAFHAYLQSPQAWTVFERYKFKRPGRASEIDPSSHE